MARFILLALSVTALAGCLPENDDAAAKTDAPIRAVQTVLVENTGATQMRAFPSVLEPPQITQLAFEVGGRLGPVDLQIGQTVRQGEVLLTIDPQDFELQLQQTEAAVTEAESALQNARDEARRQEQLFTRAVISEAARDHAVTQLTQAEARADQARRALDLVRGNSEDTQLVAPFDGIINSIDVQNFGAVQPGQPVVTLYQDNGLQARILTSYPIVSQLALGRPVVIRPADQSDKTLPATITEIARRAPAVSAFPVVAKLETTPDYLRSGMAVEVVLELPLAAEEQGILLPVSALATHFQTDLQAVGATGTDRRGLVLVVQDGVIADRAVTVAGIDESRMVITDGLRAGERVVTAGVPFLFPGQKVSLWEDPTGGVQ